jgi:hypothetical protein
LRRYEPSVSPDYSGQLRILLITLTAFVIGCTTTEEKKRLFANFANEEMAVIYLSHHNLDSVPNEIAD